MKNFTIPFPAIDYRFPMIFVRGTGNGTYLFGDAEKAPISINDFFISQFPVTQQLWEYIMGHNPSHFTGGHRPVEHVSFNDITQPGGFLDKLNIAAGEHQLNAALKFRLPSETEWEYAARGGTHWADNFRFSGSNTLDSVGWYEQNSGKNNDPSLLSKLKNHEKGTETHAAGQKSPNQLGIFDMSGNVWEWCADTFQQDVHKIPSNGTPYRAAGGERVLRGGCHHNWDIHCTVSKRYAIIPEAKDECIGFRIAASTNV